VRALILRDRPALSFNLPLSRRENHPDFLSRTSQKTAIFRLAQAVPISGFRGLGRSAFSLGGVDFASGKLSTGFGKMDAVRQSSRENAPGVLGGGGQRSLVFKCFLSVGLFFGH